MKAFHIALVLMTIGLLQMLILTLNQKNGGIIQSFTRMLG